MLKTILYIAIGGAIGRVLRFLTTVLVSKFCPENSGFQFPLATFIANVIGCFLIGLFLGILAKNQLTDSNLKWFLVTGFCGGYTTFSAFSLENIQLIQQHQWATALIYSLGSVGIGIAAVYLGLWLSQN